MNRQVLMRLLAIIGILVYSVCGQAQNPVNWTTSQLMEPSVLANEITTDKDVPVIISVGPGAVIPRSINAGMVSTPKGMAAFSAKLDSLPKDTKVVVYCGCCPFEHCPNARPAMAALKEKGFTNYYLLNLSTNVKTDWISKGYPVKE